MCLGFHARAVPACAPCRVKKKTHMCTAGPPPHQNTHDLQCFEVPPQRTRHFLFRSVFEIQDTHHPEADLRAPCTSLLYAPRAVCVLTSSNSCTLQREGYYNPEH